MKSIKTRILNVVGYQVGAFSIVVPLISWLTGHSAISSLKLTITLATLCSIWNYFFTLWFDKKVLTDASPFYNKTQRVWHTCGIEFGVLWISTPMIAYWFGYSLIQALVMDLYLILIYLVYTYIYNYIFDVIRSTLNSNGMNMTEDKKGNLQKELPL